MTDHELLNLAAKAAGYKKDIQWGVYWLSTGRGSVRVGNAWEDWNPLTDDGDALRLAVRLQLDIEQGNTYVCAVKPIPPFHGGIAEVADDRAAATRRAIVRAAAEIGRRA